MKTVWMALFTGLIACGEDKDSETTNTVFDQEGENEDNVDGSGCPSVVPEEYRFLWDCEKFRRMQWETVQTMLKANLLKMARLN